MTSILGYCAHYFTNHHDVRNFGDADGTLLLQARANKTLRRRQGLPFPTSSTWREASFTLLPSRGMARVSRLNRGHLSRHGRPDDDPATSGDPLATKNQRRPAIPPTKRD